MTYRLSLTCSMTVASSAACDNCCSELTTADSPPTTMTVPSTNTRFMTSLHVPDLRMVSTPARPYDRERPAPR